MCLSVSSEQKTDSRLAVLPSGALALGSVATPPFRPVVNGENVKVRAVRMGSETRREMEANPPALQQTCLCGRSDAAVGGMQRWLNPSKAQKNDRQMQVNPHSAACPWPPVIG